MQKEKRVEGERFEGGRGKAGEEWGRTRGERGKPRRKVTRML